MEHAKSLIHKWDKTLESLQIKVTSKRDDVQCIKRCVIEGILLCHDLFSVVCFVMSLFVTVECLAMSSFHNLCTLVCRIYFNLCKIPK